MSTMPELEDVANFAGDPERIRGRLVGDRIAWDVTQIVRNVRNKTKTSEAYVVGWYPDLIDMSAEEFAKAFDAEQVVEELGVDPCETFLRHANGDDPYDTDPNGVEPIPGLERAIEEAREDAV